MGRHTKRVTITAEGRDEGKIFELTEMDAVAGEKWAMRLLNAALKSGVSMGEIDPMAGMGGVAALGILAVSSIARMPWDLAEPLMDEMMLCVRPVTPDGTTVRERLLPTDTEEIATRLQLREEVASLHLGFSLAERFGVWMREILAKVSSSSPIFPAPSAPSPQGEKPPGES